MNRRTFLKAMAAIGGGTVIGAERVLASRELLGDRGFAASRYELPVAGNHPVKSIGCLMMENRSFDHYLGWLPGADGLLNDSGILVPPRVPDSTGKLVTGETRFPRRQPSARCSPHWCAGAATGAAATGAAAAGAAAAGFATGFAAGLTTAYHGFTTGASGTTTAGGATTGGATTGAPNRRLLLGRRFLGRRFLGRWLLIGGSSLSG